MAKGTSKAEKVAAELASECLAMRSRLIGRTIKSIYDDALRPVGVTAGQLNILAVVLRVAPVSPGDAARLLNIEKSTMSRNVALMKRNGWLAIDAGQSARIQELRITRAGREILKKAEPHWRTAQSRANEMIGPGGTEAIHQLADAIREQRIG